MDVEQADAVAFVLAHVRGQEGLINELLAMRHGDVVPLFGAVTGLLLALLADAGIDEAQVQHALAIWQERHRRSLLG